MKDGEQRFMNERGWEGEEILPSDIGGLSAREAAPLLGHAADRLEIVKPQTEFWQGLTENLKGAEAYIKVQGRSVAAKSLRVFAGASFVLSTAAACSSSVAPDVEPVPTLASVAAETQITPSPTVAAIRAIMTPTVTPEPSPEITAIIGKDLLFNGEPAGLGLLGEPYSYPETGDSGELIILSGVVTDLKQREIALGNEIQSFWIATVYLGEVEGKKVFGNFILSNWWEPQAGYEFGELLFRVDMRGRSIPGVDPNPVGGGSHSYYAQEIEEAVQDIRLYDKQYAFELYISIEPDFIDPAHSYIVSLAEYNKKILSILRREEVSLDPNAFGWILTTYFTPDHPVDSK